MKGHLYPYQGENCQHPANNAAVKEKAQTYKNENRYLFIAANFSNIILFFYLKFWIFENFEIFENFKKLNIFENFGIFEKFEIFENFEIFEFF